MGSEEEDEDFDERPEGENRTDTLLFPHSHIADGLNLLHRCFDHHSESDLHVVFFSQGTMETEKHFKITIQIPQTKKLKTSEHVTGLNDFRFVKNVCDES